MKLILEVSKDQKIIVEDQEINEIDFALGTLSIEHLWEKLKTQLEDQAE